MRGLGRDRDGGDGERRDQTKRDGREERGRDGEFGTALGEKGDDAADVAGLGRGGFRRVVLAGVAVRVAVTGRGGGQLFAVDPSVKGGTDREDGEKEHHGRSKRRGEARQQGERWWAAVHGGEFGEERENSRGVKGGVVTGQTDP